MVSGFVCTCCRERVRNKYEQYREKLEYVRVDQRERPAVFTLRQLCKRCVEHVVDERRGKAQAGDQGEMF